MSSSTTTTLTDGSYEEILAAPAIPGTNRLILQVPGLGMPLDAIKKVHTFAPDEFEAYILQWAFYYLKDAKKYVRVEKRAGPGDKGRDVIGWLEHPGNDKSQWKYDNYQCKHYGAPLMPGDVWADIGKMCYYTFRGDFPPPNKLYFIGSKGIGGKLQDYINHPDTLKEKLLDAWDTNCKNSITGTKELLLEGDFLGWVEKLDFSIFSYINDEEILDQHKAAPFHQQIFGGIVPKRPTAPKPPDEVVDKETKYVNALIEVYREYRRQPGWALPDCRTDQELGQHFNHSRVCFYSSETLKEFARENLSPDGSYFQELLKQFSEGTFITRTSAYACGYARLNKVQEYVGILQIDQSELAHPLSPGERIGMCHQLISEDVFKSWCSNV